MVWQGSVLLSRCSNDTTMAESAVVVYLVVTMVKQLNFFARSVVLSSDSLNMDVLEENNLNLFA
jgi:hypothetical protein